MAVRGQPGELRTDGRLYKGGVVGDSAERFIFCRCLSVLSEGIGPVDSAVRELRGVGRCGIYSSVAARAIGGQLETEMNWRKLKRKTVLAGILYACIIPIFIFSCMNILL